MKTDRIWLTWEKQRRNVSLSSEVDAELFELLSDKSRMLRYVVLAAKTIRILFVYRPRVVFAQNPSIVLSLLVVCCSRVFGYKAVIDQHNAGLYPFEGRNAALNKIAKLIIRSADLSIVTNSNLASFVELVGGRAAIVPDPLPFQNQTANPIPHELMCDASKLKLLFICTWASDEPYYEVIEAIAGISGGAFHLFVTGNPKDKLKGIRIPENVTLMGYISETEYVSALFNCDAVIVLTTRDNCMNCGAYEAVAAEKPGLLSNTDVLTAYFNKGFVFSGSTSESIKKSIEVVVAQHSNLKEQVKALKTELRESFPRFVEKLNDEISKA